MRRVNGFCAGVRKYKQCAPNVAFPTAAAAFSAARLIQTICNCRTLNLLNPIKPDENLIR